MLTRLSLLLTAVAATTELTTTTRRKLENADEDFSWMSGYTVQYENCFRSDNLVYFRLCPADAKCEVGCSGGGDYMIDLPTFVDAFTEAQMGAHEYACEMARENCGYDDDGLCYSNAGLNNCGDERDENAFNIQEYLECKAFDDDYYIGPYCAADNYNVYLGLFSDEDCSVQVDATVLEETYGYTLPYSTSSIVGNECANCREHGADGDQNQGDQDDDDDVLEQCEELYGGSLRCESNLDVDNADTSSCDYLNNLLSEEAATAGSPTSGRTYGGKALAGFIGALVALALFCACGGCYYCFSKSKKGSNMQAAKENLI